MMQAMTLNVGIGIPRFLRMLCSWMTMVEIIILRNRLTLWRQGLSYVLLSSMLFSEDQRVEGRLLATWELMIALLESETAARL